MFKLTTVQDVVVSVTAVDAANNPAALENTVVTSSDESVVSVSSVDGVFKLSATGKIGTSQIEVTADARIGEGEVVLTALEVIEVVAAEAVAIGLQFGEPTVRA